MTRSGLWGVRVVLAWVKFYTAAMPTPVAAERREELLADVHEQVDDAFAAGVRPSRLSRLLVGRMLRGAVADVAWRAQVEADLTGRSALLARPGAVITALGMLSLPCWMVAETAREILGWSHFVHLAAWTMVSALWAISISYALVALVYVVFERRHQR